MTSARPIQRRPLLAALGLSALAAPRLARAAGAERLSVRLDWLPWGVHAPFHLAAAKGWFTRHDLDVRLEDGNGSVTTVQLIGNGQFDVGHASLGPMAMGRSRGAPVKAIANFIRQNDIGLMMPQGSPTTVQGLRGKKLGFTNGSLETPFLDQFLAAGRLTRADVELIAIDAAAKPGVLLAGRMDGVFSSVPSLLPIVNAQKPTMAIRFADHGLTFPSFGLIANERNMAERGPALRRFASVISGAWTYIFDGHEDEAVQAVLAARAQAKLPPGVVRAQIDLIRTFLTTDATRGEPLGIMATADWEAGLRVLSDAKLIETQQPVASYFTNDLLDRDLIATVGRGAA
ncbi:ABC transporter substrate-binding protein [Roseomonas sp. NAR14]|uniref:Thiamine pyrimidine synthase n=1 Tax=Roseomonas acroporae TaxID=2937791 RepID=A0A9X1Y7G4_9PROT|nr:ABC transporter substrate-binding protein [Roseomonas acroporae]MCK8784492.1 ABC transporter substrate-binding protein [Roseomonas acroporae]